MIEEYQKNPSNVYRFGDINAFCRYVLGDERTEFFRDALRFRSYFENLNTYSFLGHFQTDEKLQGNMYYPVEGMSQFPKRMLYNATQFHETKLFLNEEVLTIDDNLDDMVVIHFSLKQHDIVFEPNN